MQASVGGGHDGIAASYDCAKLHSHKGRVRRTYVRVVPVFQDASNGRCKYTGRAKECLQMWQLEQLLQCKLSPTTLQEQCCAYPHSIHFIHLPCTSCTNKTFGVCPAIVHAGTAFHQGWRRTISCAKAKQDIIAIAGWVEVMAGWHCCCSSRVSSKQHRPSGGL